MAALEALTSRDFSADGLLRPGTWLIDFTAAACGPCRVLAPVLRSLAAEWADRIKVGQVDVDDEPELAARFDVRAMPTMMLFREGRAIAVRVGSIPKEAVVRWVAGALG